MRKKQNFLLVFLTFLLLSLLTSWLYSQNIVKNIFGVFELATMPVQRFVLHTTVYASQTEPDELTQLKEENMELRKKLVDQTEMKKENDALRAQFETTSLPPKNLLPATIISMREFIPGNIQPVVIIVDKGQEDGVKTGTIAVYKDNALGMVVYTSAHAARIELLSNPHTSFTAKTTGQEALGVIKGKDQEGILLDNVVLSDKLSIGDTVITKGDADEDGNGYPPGLIVGKIASIDKKPSALFQTAEVQSLVDITKLSTIFLMIHK